MASGQAKEETLKPINTHLHSKFYCLQSSVHPHMQHQGYSSMCWSQEQPRSLHIAGQKLSWLAGVRG